MKGPYGPYENGGRRSAPPSQPTQLGALRPHTPNGGVAYVPQPHPQAPVHPSMPPPMHAPTYPPMHAPMHPAMHAPMHAPMHQAAPHHRAQHASAPMASMAPMPPPQPYHPQPLPALPSTIAAHAPPAAATPPSPSSSSRKEKTKIGKAPAQPSAANLGDPQLGFRFKLTFPDGHHETMLVDAERALIGSAAHCEVRLPSETAAHEHVEIYAHEGAVHFSTKPNARASLPVLDDAAAVEGTWPAGSTLRIGDVAMTVELVSLGMAKAKPPIWALFVAIPAIALTAVGVALARPVDRGWPPIPEAPVLIGPKDAKCPDIGSPEQRVVFANEKLRIALAKRERSPFAPQEGFEAVELFETAAACFRASAMDAEGKDADEAADALRVKLDEEYRLRRVRLEHAYRTHQVGPAKRELAVLIPMTSHRRGAYTEWLAALDRAATLEMEERGRLAP